MRVFRILKLAAGSFRGQKVKLALMVLGVAISVALLIVAGSLTEGAMRRVDDIMKGFDSSSFMVIGGQPVGPNGERSCWTKGELLSLRAQLQGRGIISTYSFRKDVLVQHGASTTTTIINAVDPDMFLIEGWQVAEGAPLTTMDEQQTARTCVVGSTVAKQLFGDSNPVGRSLSISGLQFMVSGLFTERGVSPLGFDRDDTIWIPFSTGVRHLSVRECPTALRVKAINNYEVRKLGAEVAGLVRQLHGITPSAEDDFRLTYAFEAAQRQRQATKKVRMTGWIMAAVSLVVATGVLVNLMLLSVAQRRSEIGLKRAVGARRRDIGIELLAEATMIGLGGVACGLVLALVLVWQAPALFPTLPIALSPAVIVSSCIIALLLCLVSGIAPARRASAVDVIDALR